MPPPMVRGSSPASSALWKGRLRRSSQPAMVSCRSRLSGLTRMPMLDSSTAQFSTGSQHSRSPFSAQSS